VPRFDPFHPEQQAFLLQRRGRRGRRANQRGLGARATGATAAAALRRNLVLAAAVLLAVANAAAAADPDRGSQGAGRQVYKRHCSPCHGLRGDGAGVAAALFVFAPRDFTKGSYKFRSTASGQPPTDEDLRRSIARGVPGSAMVPQDHLSEEEAAAVLAYVKSLSARFQSLPPPRPLKLPEEAPRRQASIARGAEIYRAGGCPECHGEAGRGDGPAAPALAVPPTDLTRRPLKSGPTARDIVRTVVTGLDGTPMPSFHLMFDDADVWALAYYVESLGGAPRMTADERAGWQVEERRP
jgi:cytochrome c oxidase cbb3-type subunit 2